MPSVSHRLYGELILIKFNLFDLSKNAFKLEYLRPYLNHSFQNVRERLGSILINICEADIPFIGSPKPECPRIKAVIDEVVSKINILSDGFQKVKSGERGT